ncbi:MAG: hypothetical protein HZA93_04365 [Verrucomicrobia bacterium]|nr:hypothetical protein [Verrucomicrobiota bacterium]
MSEGIQPDSDADFERSVAASVNHHYRLVGLFVDHRHRTVRIELPFRTFMIGRIDGKTIAASLQMLGMPLWATVLTGVGLATVLVLLSSVLIPIRSFSLILTVLVGILGAVLLRHGLAAVSARRAVGEVMKRRWLAGGDKS